MENPSLKWMMTGGSPRALGPPPYTFRFALHNQTEFPQECFFTIPPCHLVTLCRIGPVLRWKSREIAISRGILRKSCHDLRRAEPQGREEGNGDECPALGLASNMEKSHGIPCIFFKLSQQVYIRKLSEGRVVDVVAGLSPEKNREKKL